MNQELLTTFEACREELTALTRRVTDGGADLPHLETMKRVLRLLRRGGDGDVELSAGGRTNGWFANDDGDADATNRRYRALIETLPVGIYHIAFDGTLLAVNPAEIAMYGYDSEAEMKEANAVSFYMDPADRGILLERLRKEGSIADYECRQRRKDGSLLWISTSVNAEFDERGDIAFLNGIDVDITLRKEAELALRASEEKYRMLIETIPHGISENDIDGIVTFSNPAHEKMLGFGPGETIGQPVCDAAAATDTARRDLMEHFRYLVETQPTPTSYVMRNRTVSGDIIDVQVDWNYKRDEKGRLVGFISVITDITNRLWAEEALRASEERARAQYQALPVPTLTWEYAQNDFTLVDFNMAARDLTEGKIVKFMGRKAGEIFSPRPEILQALMRCYRERIVIKRELEYTFLSTGHTRQLSAICSYGPPDLVLMHIEDITERKEAEARRQAATRERFEQARQIAGAFAHEIRNALFPAAAALNKIKSAALDRHNDSDYYKKYAVIAERAVTNATGTTRLISTYAKLDTEKNPERVVLSEVIDEVLANNKMRLGEENITVAVDGDEHVRVVSNRKQLVLALNNVIINSLQALSGRPRPEISISWERDGKAVHLMMSDNGGGIPAEILPSVFEPFFSTRSESGGTGIGLATTRKVIRMYGGAIGVESVGGRGACFAISLTVDDSTAP